MAESYNTETQEIEKTVGDVINNIEYEIMETQLGVLDNFLQEPTVGDLAG